MNKITKLLVCLLLTSNVFAMQSRDFSKIIPFAAITAKKQVLPPIIKPPIPNECTAGQNFQTILQSIELSALLEDKIIPETKLVQSSLTVRKSSGGIGSKEDLSALFHESANLLDLMEAIKVNDFVKIKTYLLNEDDLFDEITFEDNCNILMFAIKHGSVKTVMFLLQKHKFYLEDVDLKGRTALMYAANNNKMFDVVVELLSKGADVNKEDKKKRNALTYTAYKVVNIKTAVALLNNKANYEQIDEDGLSILYHAAFNQNIKMVEILLLCCISKSQAAITLNAVIEEINKLDEEIKCLDSAIKNLNEETEEYYSDNEIQNLNKKIEEDYEAKNKIIKAKDCRNAYIRIGNMLNEYLKK